jgi:hypothetical protein
MPASVHISADYFKRDTFEVWSPWTTTFGPRTVTGRKKRIDPFVSLWHRSSRRVHIHVHADEDVSTVHALRGADGTIYLISGTVEQDAWQGDDNTYDRLWRAHKVSAPSGGFAYHYPVTVSGTGDDLGPVTVGPALLGLIDTELRSTADNEQSLQVAEAEYFVAYSGNLTVQDADFFQALDGTWYRVMETHADSGYRYSRAKQDQPRYQTVEFKLPSATPAIFDPQTGRLTGGSELTRQVSVLLRNQTRTGHLGTHTLAETLDLFIYQNHIGFTPRLGYGVVLDNVRYTVESVTQVTTEKQWRVGVSR